MDSILDQKNTADDDISENNNKHKNSLLSCSFLSVMSLDQAIGFYPKPRIVAESKYPFTVVHVNGRFTYLTKLESNEVIGEKLSNLGLSGNLNELLFDCIKESEIGKEVIVNVLSRKTISFNTPSYTKEESMHCFMTVLPVSNYDSKTGVMNEMMKLTHFVLELKKCIYPLFMFD